VVQKLFKRLDSVAALQLFQLLRYGTLVLLGVFFAKIGVPKSSIASLESLIFISGLVSFFWVNSCIQLLLSEYASFNEIEKKKSIFRYFITFQLFSFIASVIVYFGADSTYSSTIAVFILFGTPSLLNEYILYLNNRKKTLLAYGILSSSILIVLSIGLISFFVFVFNEPIEKCFGVTLIAFVTVAFLRWLYTLFLLFRFSSPDISIIENTNWATLFILVTGFLLSGSSEYITGWFVKHFSNASAFTTFRYGTKEMPLFTLMAAALSNSMISVIVADEKNGIALLKQKGRQQMHIFFPIAIALTLAAPLLFKFVFSEAFYESGKLFSFTMLLTIPRQLFPQPILHAKGAQQWLTIAMFCEIVMLILFSFIGFHFFGLQGLVAAIVLSYLVEKLVLIVTLKYKFNIPLSDYLALQWFLFYSVTLLCSYLLTFVFY
jgi:O-antigen/teichoic acid export membrane protein